MSGDLPGLLNSDREPVKLNLWLLSEAQHYTSDGAVH